MEGLDEETGSEGEAGWETAECSAEGDGASWEMMRLGQWNGRGREGAEGKERKGSGCESQ